MGIIFLHFIRNGKKLTVSGKISKMLIVNRKS